MAPLLLALVFLLLAALFCVIELALLLVHRLRLEVFADAGNRRAALLVRLLSREELARATPLVGFHLSVAATAALAYLGALSLGWPWPGRRLVELGFFGLLVLLVEVLPRRLVPLRPTRILVVLAYPFAFFYWLFGPLGHLLAALRRVPGRGAPAPPRAAAFPLRDDLRQLIARPELGILEEREAQIAARLLEFGSTLVRDVMTPIHRVVSVPAGACVRDVFAAVRRAGFTRIPVHGERKEKLLGLINVHDVLHEDPEKHVAPFLRSAPRVHPNSLAHSLFVYLQRHPDWMAFVQEGGECCGIATVEDLVEEILGEIYDEFELPRPRYVPAGRRRLRASGALAVAELQTDLGLESTADPEETLADVVRAVLGRPPEPGERVLAGGLELYVTRIEDGRAAELEVLRVAAAEGWP